MLDGVTSSVDVNLSGLQATVKDREACMLQSTGSQRVGHDSVPGQKQQYAESKKKNDANLQNRNRFTDIENKCMITKGERGEGEIN